jgi:hypothetical protein
VYFNLELRQILTKPNKCAKIVMKKKYILPGATEGSVKVVIAAIYTLAHLG